MMYEADFEIFKRQKSITNPTSEDISSVEDISQILELYCEIYYYLKNY